MIFWLLAAVLTALALNFVLRPLFRASAGEGIAPQEVYKAQLAEIEREAAAGLLSAADAASARTEIARRILRADASGSANVAPRRWDPRFVAGAVAGFIVIAGLGLYLAIGHPELPGQPFATRDLGAESADILGPAAQELERRLNELEDPADRAILLGDAFVSLGGLDEADQAYRNALRRRPDDPDILLRLAEVEVMRGQGVVTAGALSWIDQALSVTPEHPAANYYRALYDYQQGNTDAAVTRLTELLSRAPEGAEWTGQVAALLEEVQTTATASAIAGMDDADRDAMIRTMVDQLAARLEEDPDDFDGWLRLANSYAVLGERDAAQGALSRARELANGEPVLTRRVEDVARNLSLE